MNPECHPADSLAASTKGYKPLSLAGVDGMEKVTDDRGLREAVRAALKKEQGAIIDPRLGKAFPVPKLR